MKRETKYSVILGSMVVLFVLVELYGPKPLDWTPTFSPKDKNPFGAFVTNRLFQDFFIGQKIMTNNLTFYELKDSIQTDENIISISNRFDPDTEATEVLLNKVDSGAHAFISAYSFEGKFKDTLSINTLDVYFSFQNGVIGKDTSDLKFVIPKIEKRGYYYRLENISYFFSMPDSLKAQSHIISTNAWGEAVTLRIPWGKGYFILNTTPLAFTNNYLLYEDNYKYAAQTLSYLPVSKTWWTSYHQVGRMEAESPLRFILNNESLRWAYYIGILSLLLFIIVEAKRKQRSIPIIKPLANTSMEFIQTIGNMYLHASDHKAIAEKKIVFFLEQVRSKYFLSGESGDQFVLLLAKKSGNDLQQTQKLFSLIKVIQNTPGISVPMLTELNTQMEEFASS